jgi:hypothetical protein
MQRKGTQRWLRAAAVAWIAAVVAAHGLIALEDRLPRLLGPSAQVRQAAQAASGVLRSLVYRDYVWSEK